MIQKYWPTILFVVVLCSGAFYVYGHQSQENAAAQQRPGRSTLVPASSVQQDDHPAANPPIEQKPAQETMVPAHYTLRQPGYQFTVTKIGWHRNGHVDVTLRLVCILQPTDKTAAHQALQMTELYALPAAVGAAPNAMTQPIYGVQNVTKKSEFDFDIEAVDPRQKTLHVDFGGMLPTPISVQSLSVKARQPYFLRGGVDIKLATLPHPGADVRITKQSSLTISGTTYTYQHFEAGHRFNGGNLIWIKSHDPNSSYTASMQDAPVNGSLNRNSYANSLTTVYWHVDGTPVGPGESGGYFDQQLPMSAPRNIAISSGTNSSNTLIYKNVPVPDADTTDVVDETAKSPDGSKVMLQEIANRYMYDTDSWPSTVPQGQTSLQLVFSANVFAESTVSIPTITVNGRPFAAIAASMGSHTWLAAKQTEGTELFSTNILIPTPKTKKLNLIVSWVNSSTTMIPDIILSTDGTISVDTAKK